MIVYRCIEFYPKGYRWWIIIIGLRVLLITHCLIQEILMELVLDVLRRDLKTKKFIDPDVLTIHLLQKGSYWNTCFGLHIENRMSLMRPW